MSQPTPAPGRYTHDDGNTITFAHPWTGSIADLYNFFGAFDAQAGWHLHADRLGLLSIRSPRGSVLVPEGDLVLHTLGVTGLYDTLTPDRFGEVFTPAPLPADVAALRDVLTRAINGIDPADEALTGSTLVEDPEVLAYLIGQR